MSRARTALLLDCSSTTLRLLHYCTLDLCNTSSVSCELLPRCPVYTFLFFTCANVFTWACMSPPYFTPNPSLSHLHTPFHSQVHLDRCSPKRKPPTTQPQPQKLRFTDNKTPTTPNSSVPRIYMRADRCSPTTKPRQQHAGPLGRPAGGHAQSLPSTLLPFPMHRSILTPPNYTPASSHSQPLPFTCTPESQVLLLLY